MTELSIVVVITFESGGWGGLGRSRCGCWPLSYVTRAFPLCVSQGPDNGCPIPFIRVERLTFDSRQLHPWSFNIMSSPGPANEIQVNTMNICLTLFLNRPSLGENTGISLLSWYFLTYILWCSSVWKERKVTTKIIKIITTLHLSIFITLMDPFFFFFSALWC